MLFQQQESQDWRIKKNTMSIISCSKLTTNQIGECSLPNNNIFERLIQRTRANIVWTVKQYIATKLFSNIFIIYITLTEKELNNTNKHKQSKSVQLVFLDKRNSLNSY